MNLPKSSIKSTKERLVSRLALAEMFGSNNVDTLFEGNYCNEDDECGLGIIDSVQQGQANSDAACYLGGLLWNLETYLNGCCVDYGYNYGSRASHTPHEVRMGRYRLPFWPYEIYTYHNSVVG